MDEGSRVVHARRVRPARCITRLLSFPCSLVAIGLAALAAAQGGPKNQPQTCPQESGCWESCQLADAPAEKASPLFLSRLGAIAPTKHHVDSRFGAALVERLDWLTILNFSGLTPENAKQWQLNRRYAGPCTRLVAVFWSRVVEDADKGNVVDLYELRYPDAAAARRVQALLTGGRAWDWNYHPSSAARDDRSVIVIEGRNRAWSAFKRVALHFGAPVSNWPDLPLPVCGRNPEGKPLLAIPAKGKRPALSVFALGFSTAGRLAWLEQREGPGERDVEWSVRVVDLVDDRALAAQSFRGGKGVAGMCARHGEKVADLLRESAIQRAVDLALEQPAPGRDPTGVVLRPGAPADRSHTPVDVVLRATAGEKRIGVFAQATGSGTPTVLGILRSPFEPRVAVAVAQEAPGSEGAGTVTIRFFGGRLDKGWAPSATQ